MARPYAACIFGVAILAAVPVSAPAGEASPDAEFPSADNFEVRFGALPAGLWGRENGTTAVNGDFVVGKFVATDIPSSWGWLVPRLHVGVMANVGGGTSYAYAGALWTYKITNRFFAEISFGGAVNNGILDGAPGRSAVGCRYEYNPGASLGMYMNPKLSVMLTFDHMSNGEPTLSSCPKNEGLNEIGMRVGYSF
jgi:lipid A 3-O-deacylase